MLRDPYTNKPYVGFYSTMRVGGFLKDSEAIKLVKCVAADSGASWRKAGAERIPRFSLREGEFA